MTKTNDAVEAAKAAAYQAYVLECDHDVSSPTYKGWPQSVCNVCRGQFSDESFFAGFDAGLRHADEWVVISGPDDLPTKSGEYLWTDKDLGRVHERYLYAHDVDCRNCFVQHHTAWRERPAPYNPKEDESNGR